jgi:predicted transcriptional regulator
MAKKKGLHYFFLRRKPVMILVNLAKDEKLRYASALAKEVDCTYSHTVKLLSMMQKNGLVEFNKRGRLKTLNLTPVGREIAGTLSKTMGLFDKVDG